VNVGGSSSRCRSTIPTPTDEVVMVVVIVMEIVAVAAVVGGGGGAVAVVVVIASGGRFCCGCEGLGNWGKMVREKGERGGTVDTARA